MYRPRKRPSLDHWYALKLRIRCELVEYEARDRVISRLNAETEAMIHCGNLCAWHGYRSLFQLFVDSAMDLALSRPGGADVWGWPSRRSTIWNRCP